MIYQDLAEEIISLRSFAPRMQMDRRISKGVQGEAFVMNFLYEHNCSAYPRELSVAMNVSTARIASLLRCLEKKEYIKRSTDENDCRQIVVTLTETGKLMINDKHHDTVDLLASVFEELGEEDAREYVRINKKLAKIVANKFI